MRLPHSIRLFLRGRRAASRDFFKAICPGCRSHGMQWIAEAPGSTSALACRACWALWTTDLSHGRRVQFYGLLQSLQHATAREPQAHALAVTDDQAIHNGGIPNAGGDNPRRNDSVFRF